MKRTFRYNSLFSQNHPRVTPTYDLLATRRHLFSPFQRIREANHGTHDNHFHCPISYVPIFDESEPSEPAPFPSDNEDEDIESHPEAHDEPDTQSQPEDPDDPKNIDQTSNSSSFSLAFRSLPLHHGSHHNLPGA